ncbi:MAG: pyridoxamine 5'-phosphate oxidase family protein [Microcoleaceae cyanobacterium]
MVNSGWSHSESPFHPGEIAMQTQLGIAERMDQQGRRLIRDYLPDQHRQFFAQLAYLVVGTVDGLGNLWASILVGKPGFLTSANEHTLTVSARPLFGDPLTETLKENIDIGLLGIDFQTRRRNRLNGIVTAINQQGFEVQVKQSFGNCPQYIQVRNLEFKSHLKDITTPKPVHRISILAEQERDLITSANTLFIATAYQDQSAGMAAGVDVSHRGGQPGFVSIDQQDRLIIADFPGNSHFNTIGNLLLNPRTGLLFIDFEQGNLLYLTGTTEVIESKEEINNDQDQKVERFLCFNLSQGYRVEGSLPKTL